MKKLNLSMLEEAYRAHNQKRVCEKYLAGSICGVWDKEGELFRDTVGFADLAGTRRIEGNTVFRMASMTKPVTAVAVMQLVERGKLTLDTPICAFLPAYERMRVAHGILGGRIQSSHEAGTLITPRHLLSHASGLGSGSVGTLQAKTVKKVFSLAASVDNYAASFLSFEPETSVQYSPLWAFDVLARLVELLSDMPYEEYIKENIFEPLGMVDTTYFPSDEQAARCADFLERGPDGLFPRAISKKAGFVDFADGMVCGGAGLFSTLDDYARFAQMLLGEGSFGDVKLLEPFSVKQMSENQVIFTARGQEENPFGLSVRVCGEPNGDKQPLPRGCFGWSGAFGTHFWVDPQNQIACIYLMNLANGGGSDEAASREFERDVMRGL